MKRLLLLALIAAPCFALTTVQDTLYTATGAFCSGTVTLSWETFTSATDGHTVYEGMYDFAVTGALNGLTVTLEPGQYTASYNITPSGCAPQYEQWIVPASPGTVSLSGVRSINPPVPYSLISPTWIAADGATVGQGMCFLGPGQWGPGNCGGGSGGMTWPAAAGLPFYGGSNAWGTSVSAANGLYGLAFASSVPSLTALGTAAAATLGTSGAQVPLLNGANTWSALQTVASITGAPGVVDLSGSTHTRPAIVVAAAGSLPGTCGVGELGFVSGATAGQQIYECSAANVWTQQVAGGGGGSAPAPVFSTYASRGTCTSTNTGQIFHASDVSNKHWECDGATWQPVAFDMQVVEPTALTWTPVVGAGTDTPTIANVAGAVQLSAARASTNTNVYNFLGMLTPISISTPYTIEIAFTADADLGGYASCAWGVANGNAATSAFFGPVWNNGYGGSASLTICASLFDNFCAGYTGATTAPRVFAEPVIRSEMVDDGVNRDFYLNTGSGWQLQYSASDTFQIASPTYFGIGCLTGSLGDRFQLTLYHASVHH